ncbi:hypothetical protein [Robbsia sp. KACC 23696]|uniref:hypothetical protein n=1 Tax=Robbsia sp. KACC 23696 TaxID=3149231 RepID=UPI00325AD8FB
MSRNEKQGGPPIGGGSALARHTRVIRSHMAARDRIRTKQVARSPNKATIDRTSCELRFARCVGTIGLAVALGVSVGACALLPDQASRPASKTSGTTLASTLAAIDPGTRPTTAVPDNAASAASAPVDMRPVPSDLRVVNSGADSRVANVAAGTAVDNEAAQNPMSPSYQTVSTTPPAPRVRTIDPETMRLALALATGPTRVRSQGGNTSGSDAVPTVAGDANGWQLQSVVAMTRPDAGPSLARMETQWLGTQQLLPLRGCPAPNQVYMYADLSTRAGDSARRAADAMAAGCGVAVHRQTDLGRPDPLFDSIGSRACVLDPNRLRRDVRSGPLARQIQGKKSTDALLEYANADQGALLRASPYLTSRRATLAMRQVLGALTQQRFGVTVPWTHASTDSRVYWITGDGPMFDAVTTLLDGMAARRPGRRADQPAQWLFSLWRNPSDNHYYVRVNAIDPRAAAPSHAKRATAPAWMPSSGDALRLSQCDGSDSTGACALEDFQRSIGQQLAKDCTRLTP